MAATTQPSSTVTMLFSDMEGSTALLRKLGDDYGPLLARQRSLLREIWERYNGQEMGTEGDSFFVTFRTAADAAGAALDAQRTIGEMQWPRGVVVRLRIGLHTGEPLDQDEGYVGIDVHRAARIAGVAHGGQVLISESTRQLVMGRLPEGARLLDLGSHNLKDLPTAEHLYQLSGPGVDVDFPPLRTVDTGTIELGVLGPVRVVRGGQQVSLRGPKQRAVLAALVLKANRVVSTERLIAAVWGPDAWPRAEIALARHIASLRTLLQAPDVPELILRRREGYELRIDRECVDLLRFENLVAEASKYMADEHHDRAVRTFDAALREWRGEPLADLPLDSFRTTVDRLEEARLTATEDRLEAELASGRHRELVADLECLVSEHPRRERIWGQLILALYRSGQRGDALMVYRRAQDLLRSSGGPGPELRDLGRRIEDEDPDLAAPAGASRPKVKLPPAGPSDLFGRATDIDALSTHVNARQFRLLTLTGPGGVGKTRLAVEVAAQSLEAFSGGTYFVSLANVTDPGLVLPAVASVLEIPEAADEALTQSVAVSLGPQPTLVVLDNLEQVPEAHTVLNDLLQAAPGLQIIATSRRPLRVRSELEYPVAPLDLPAVRTPGAPPLTVAAASTHPAIELFVARSRAVSPEFELNVTNAETIAAICARLDGVPLAIELAAARSVLLAPSQLLARLDHQLNFLTGGQSDLPTRHRTLRAAIDWSYHLLDPEQQHLLARLGVFAGTFSAEDAQVVASVAPDSSDANDVLDHLLTLVECSLVRRLPGSHETRFRLLETVQEYACERLAEAGDEATTTRHRLVRYLLDRAEAAHRSLDGSDAPQVLAALRSQDADLRAALEWALGRGDGDLAARLAASLRVYWLLEGRMTEGRMWTGRVLDVGGLEPALEARVHLAAGVLAYFQDDPDQAQLHLERALAHARQESEEEIVALTLGFLGALTLRDGDTATAEEMVAEASDIANRLGCYEGQVLALSLAAVIAAMHEDLDRESSLYGQRLDVARRRGDCRRIAETLANLAEIALIQNNAEQARAYAEESLKLARGVDRLVTRDALLALGRVELALGRPKPAADTLTDALRFSLDLGQKFEVAQVLLALGSVASVDGDHDRAAVLFGAGDRLHGATAPLAVDLEPDTAQHRERTRDALGPDEFHVAQLHGAALPLEDVATLALSRPAT